MIPGIIASTNDTEKGGSSGGGGGGYTAAAVHFAGSIQGNGPTYLSISSLTCTDNGLFSISYYTNGLCASANDNGTYLVSDPLGNYFNFFGLTTINEPADFNWHFYDVSAKVFTTRTTTSSAGWHHVVASFETTKAASSKIASIYLDDVQQTLIGDIDADPSFTPVFNGLSLYFGDDSFGDGPDCDFADVWIAPGVGLHQSDGTILTADRRQFITAGKKPVDPTGWPTSAVQFYGDHIAFSTNRGTGGSFSLTGSLSDSSTHP